MLRHSLVRWLIKCDITRSRESECWVAVLKTQHFLKKLWKTIYGSTWLFWEEGTSSGKNQYNLFCRKWGFKYFSFGNFFKKKKHIFQNNCEKLFLGKRDHFVGKIGVEGQKWVESFLWGMVYQTLFISFFLKKFHTDWIKAKKLVLGAHFPPHRWFYWTDCFLKQQGSPMGGPALSMRISWKSAENLHLYHMFLCINNYPASFFLGRVGWKLAWPTWNLW